MRTVYVTKSEHLAAQALVERAAKSDRPVEPWIVAIARARPTRPNETVVGAAAAI